MWKPDYQAPVAQFIEERCELRPGATSSAAELLAEFQQWGTEKYKRGAVGWGWNYYFNSAAGLGRGLRENAIQRYRTAKGNRYAGIAIKNPAS